MLLQEALHTLGDGSLILAHCNCKVNAVLFRELLQIVQEFLCLRYILDAGDLIQAVDKYTGDVVVTGMDAAYETEQARVILDRIVGRVDQARIVRNIESQLIAARNANNAALLFFYRGVDLIDDFLRLARAGAANDKFYLSLYPPNLCGCF